MTKLSLTYPIIRTVSCSCVQLGDKVKAVFPLLLGLSRELCPPGDWRLSCLEAIRQNSYCHRRIFLYRTGRSIIDNLLYKCCNVGGLIITQAHRYFMKHSETFRRPSSGIHLPLRLGGIATGVPVSQPSDFSLEQRDYLAPSMQKLTQVEILLPIPRVCRRLVEKCDQLNQPRLVSHPE